MLWRQWKRSRTRAARLMQQGLDKEQISGQWARGLVELRGIAHERSVSQEIL